MNCFVCILQKKRTQNCDLQPQFQSFDSGSYLAEEIDSIILNLFWGCSLGSCDSAGVSMLDEMFTLVVARCLPRAKFSPNVYTGCR